MGGEVVLIAVSDVHSPRFLMHYMSALSKHKEECDRATAVLWAGDMVDKGRVDALAPVVRITKSMCRNARIIASFGNEEYFDREHMFMTRYNDIIWLEDRHLTIETPSKRIAIYGTRGALDEPTSWQKKHIPSIRLIYKNKIKKLEENVSKLKREGYFVIVLMHYAPTYSTLEGEDRGIWKFIGSKQMEDAIKRSRPDIVIHGHAHNSVRYEVKIDGIRIINVALPARRDVTVIKV